MDQDPSSSRRAPAGLERGLLVVLLLLAGALTALWWARSGGWMDDSMELTDGPEPAYAGRVDPNTASWQWLACLPGIGETKAKAIVQYRLDRVEGAAVFRRPEDLARVPGIGPATVRRVAPFLVFPETEGGPTGAPAAPTTAPADSSMTAPLGGPTTAPRDGPTTAPDARQARPSGLPFGAVGSALEFPSSSHTIPAPC